jgi:lysophospholipase L1-like esterase
MRAWIATLACCLLALAGAEGIVRIFGADQVAWPAVGPYAAPGGGAFDGVEIDPLLGPLPKPDWSGTWLGGFPVTIDARGFRSTGRPPPASPSARVAFLGDSCTFGWGVTDQETYVARLDAMQRTAGAPELELVNGGYPGDSAVTGLYRLRERILPLGPDVVVLAFSANNAFRLALRSDARRFALFELRRLFLRSGLVRALSARALRSGDASVHPRDRKAILEREPGRLARVAAPGEFEAALRSSVAEARSAGAEVLLLLLPRAHQVSDEYGYEDAALQGRRVPKRLVLRGKLTPGAYALVESSCLDLGRADLVPALQGELRTWRPVRPTRGEVLDSLRSGARSWVAGDLAGAEASFEAALRLQPDSPLAHYDLGVVELASRRTEEGLRHLATADRLACNVFLQYEVAVWRVAMDLDVPVVDMVLGFQAVDAGRLFIDSAHPNGEGHRLIADALWSRLRSLATR